MNPVAYTVFQEFPPEPPRTLRVDRHYLLYAAKGAMRLEAEGRSWSLHPARAALLTAGEPIDVHLPQRMTVCSALFATDFAPSPPATLRVFDMSPLARELVLACRHFGPDTDLEPHAVQLFKTLQLVTWRLADRPNPVSMPTGRSKIVRQALALTEARMASALSFESIAAELAISPRSLARRFSDELGMTWRQALRHARVLRAIELLATPGTSVASAAFATGYNALSAFNSAFREVTGTSPTEYRRSFDTSAEI